MASLCIARFAAIVGFAIVPGLAVPLAGAAEVDPTGRALFVRYCGACHGQRGTGDGIVAPFMHPKPVDLTRIAEHHGGEFPLAEVVKAIDGREMVHAHGEPTMPVWGQVLGEHLGSRKQETRPVGVERRVQGSILAIAEYVRTLQQ